MQTVKAPIRREKSNDQLRVFQQQRTETQTLGYPPLFKKRQSRIEYVPVYTCMQKTSLFYRRQGGDCECMIYNLLPFVVKRVAVWSVGAELELIEGVSGGGVFKKWIWEKVK